MRNIFPHKRTKDVFILLHEVLLEGPPEGMSRLEMMKKLKQKKAIDDAIIDDIIYRYKGGLNDPDFVLRFQNSKAYHLMNTMEHFMGSAFSYRNIHADNTGEEIPFKA